MKNVTFKFENGQTETFDIHNPRMNPYDFAMYGVAASQNKSTDPEEWMDDFNDWSEEEGNNWKADYGDCIGYDVETPDNNSDVLKANF